MGTRVRSTYVAIIYKFDALQALAVQRGVCWDVCQRYRVCNSRACSTLT